VTSIQYTFTHKQNTEQHITQTTQKGTHITVRISDHLEDLGEDGKNIKMGIQAM
jgi:hypothetical protein